MKEECCKSTPSKEGNKTRCLAKERTPTKTLTKKPPRKGRTSSVTRKLAPKPSRKTLRTTDPLPITAAIPHARTCVFHGDLLCSIMSFLPLSSLVLATSINRPWRKKVISTARLWRVLNFLDRLPPVATVISLAERAGRHLEQLHIYSGRQTTPNETWPLLFKRIIEIAPHALQHVTAPIVQSRCALGTSPWVPLVIGTGLKRISNRGLEHFGWQGIPDDVMINGAAVSELPCVRGECQNFVHRIRGVNYSDTRRKRQCVVCGSIRCVTCSNAYSWQDSEWQFECASCLKCFCNGCDTRPTKGSPAPLYCYGCVLGNKK